MSAVNYVGVQYGSGVQALVTVGKLLAIVLIVALGLTLGFKLPAHFVGPATPPPPVGVPAFLAAVVAGLFTFGGWHQVTYTSGETVDPARTVPRALVWGTLIVTAVYVLLNLVYLFVLPLDKVASSTRIAADTAEALLGPGAGGLVSGFVLFSVLGTLTALILLGPRVYFAMARDGIVFRWLGDVHPAYRTPHRAIVLQAIWAAVLVATGTFRALFTRVTYTEWIFFGLLAVGLIVLRRRPDVKREWSMWGAPALPALFAAGSFAIVINQVLHDPKESAIGLGLVLAGLPVYYLWGRRGAVQEPKS
jgi:APA family basic amino acid/polyamine antiporter